MNSAQASIYGSIDYQDAEVESSGAQEVHDRYTIPQLGVHGQGSPLQSYETSHRRQLNFQDDGMYDSAGYGNETPPLDEYGQ